MRQLHYFFILALCLLMTGRVYPAPSSTNLAKSIEVPKWPPEPDSPIIAQIQEDVRSDDWTGTKNLLLNTVFSVISKEYTFLENLKNFQILPLEAAAEGYIKIIQVLIINGLNVDSTFGSLRKTMLHEAAIREQNEVVNYLISKGADVNLRGAHGRTAIHKAVDSGALSTLSILLENGANINDQDYYGLTPLHIAVMYNSPKTVKFLVDHKADKSIKDRKYRTPLELARILKRTNLLPFLE